MIYIDTASWCMSKTPAMRMTIGSLIISILGSVSFSHEAAEAVLKILRIQWGDGYSFRIRRLD